MTLLEDLDQKQAPDDKHEGCVCTVRGQERGRGRGEGRQREQVIVPGELKAGSQHDVTLRDARSETLNQTLVLFQHQLRSVEPTYLIVVNMQLSTRRSSLKQFAFSWHF